MTGFLKAIANNEDSTSLAARLRRKRFKILERLVHDIRAGSPTILDVGGTELFWEVRGYAHSNCRITLLNLHKIGTHYDNIISVAGEPRFPFPFFQFLLSRLNISLAAHFKVGCYHRKGNPVEAEKVVDEIRLLKESELKTLFPDAEIHPERFFGLTKSFIVTKSS